MKLFKIAILLPFTAYAMNMCSSTHDNTNATTSDINKEYKYVALSKDLIRVARNKTSYADIKQKLATVPVDTLAKELDNDEAKKAFWINIYNAYVQLVLSENPDLFEDRDKFFGEDRVTIAGHELSFDEIEHGIIRNSKVKWLLGFVKNPFASKLIRTFRVDKVDPRIHFTINCGAKSCPKVAIYTVKTLDQQLDIATRQYLQETTTYKPEEEKVYVTSLLSWFRGDFGGKKGIQDFLKAYDIIPEESDPALEFKEYDWTLDLGNYKEINVASPSQE